MQLGEEYVDPLAPFAPLPAPAASAGFNWGSLANIIPGVIGMFSPPAGVTSANGVPSGMNLPAGVTPGDRYYPPTRQGSLDNTTLTMIAMGGLALILLLKR